MRNSKKTFADYMKQQKELDRFVRETERVEEQRREVRHAKAKAHHHFESHSTGTLGGVARIRKG